MKVLEECLKQERARISAIRSTNFFNAITGTDRTTTTQICKGFSQVQQSSGTAELCKYKNRPCNTELSARSTVSSAASHSATLKQSDFASQVKVKSCPCKGKRKRRQQCKCGGKLASADSPEQDQTNQFVTKCAQGFRKCSNTCGKSCRVKNKSKSSCAK